MSNKPTILLINSNTQELRACAMYLNKKGLGVLVASQFMQGKEIALKKLPELIVFFENENEEAEAKKTIHELSDLLCKTILYRQNKDSGETFLGNTHILQKTNPLKEDQIFQDSIKICPDLISLEAAAEEKLVQQEIKGRPKILLIEDNNLNQIYFGEILNKLPVTYTLSEGVLSARNEIDKQNFDLIISDVKLNDGNGIHFMKSLKEELKTTIPFIFISGYSKPELERMYGAFEATAVLTKPVEEIVLIKNIKDCLNKRVKSQNTAEKEAKKYNYLKIYQILKNDKSKIEISINEFHALIKKSLITTQKALETNNFEELRPSFHDLLNLCTYFGADHLFELVMCFRRETEVTHKVDFLEQIYRELQAIDNYSKEYDKTASS